jgi:hypothetical protein
LDANGNCLPPPGSPPDPGEPPSPPPGPLHSYLLNAYYLFGLNYGQITSPARSIYIAERRTGFCDVHFHPWLGEVEDPAGPNDTVNPIAIANTRHFTGSNSVYADGHAKWAVFSQTRQPFEGHELYGEYQAF